MKTGKTWGDTTLILNTPLVSVHRLDILPNYTCSMHKHNFKWNAFLIWEGKLIIEVRKNDYALTDRTVLLPGELTSVKPGEFHRFITESEGCKGIEFYYLEPLSDDIIRESCGGPAPVPASAT